MMNLLFQVQHWFKQFVCFFNPNILKTETQGEIISPQRDTSDLKECLKRYRDIN